jgi:hypothetical protein
VGPASVCPVKRGFSPRRQTMSALSSRVALTIGSAILAETRWEEQDLMLSYHDSRRLGDPDELGARQSTPEQMAGLLEVSATEASSKEN